MIEDLATKVQELLDSTINPAVAGHGGFVQLIDVAPSVLAILGGGAVRHLATRRFHREMAEARQEMQTGLIGLARRRLTGLGVVPI